ncbi:MAG: Inner rane component of cytoplasmic domain [Thermoplasmata archaeon]|jgi:DNA-binding transcriptional ArsR family regulator|nr:Inner rane component of cytoplasmic domain [Thermoplasmata archaeon]
MEPVRPSDEALSLVLGALASPTRLAILRTLRTPRALREIEVASEEDGRPITRQAIRRHLDTLLEAGLISTREAGREYGDTTEFILNHARLYGMGDDVRQLARLRPAVDPGGETAPSADLGAQRPRGPVLVLVKGADEGQAFHLDPGAGEREWIVGRRRGVAVCLDYDAAVSSENSRIGWREGAHWIEDVVGSRNGTWLNLRRLAPGESTKLAHGDLVGAGRSALLYWR